jgi:phosphoribosylformylglycinamidine synthase PurS subunit|tara:strand:+ start:723 stop:1016 length:294 start_codon:yes stop_codon:yes gene_type:complete
MPLDRWRINTVFQGRSQPMKVKVIVTPKQEVLDPQGKTVQTALEQMGCTGVNEVRVGKYIEIEMDGDPDEVKEKLSEYADKFLANPNIEDYRLKLED